MLSEGEWKLMSALWEQEPKTVSQLVSELKESTGWTKGTVFMMLSRLCEKGAVAAEEDGRLKRYRPLLRRQEATRRETESFLSRVYDGSLRLMLSSMADAGSLSEEDI